MAATIAALVEAGTAFADALQCNQDRPLSAAALKALQQAAKSGFRQASTSWTRARQLQEAWVKASALRRRAAKKVSVSATSHAEAEAWLETVDGEHQDSLAAEERESSSRLACEQALLEAEALQSAAEVETAGQKCHRFECQANIAAARSKLKPAKVAEKQASAGRVALLNHYTKVDKGQIKMELQATESSAKEARSALSALKAEEYDANQVEEAYNQARKKLRADGE
jgi:hypothetical protein